MTLFSLFWTRKVFFFSTNQARYFCTGLVRGPRQGRIWCWWCQILDSCSGRPWNHCSGTFYLLVSQKCLRKTWWKDTVKIRKKQTKKPPKTHISTYGFRIWKTITITGKGSYSSHLQSSNLFQFHATSDLGTIVVCVHMIQSDHNTLPPLKHSAIERHTVTIIFHGMEMGHIPLISPFGRQRQTISMSLSPAWST